jgi:2-(1,2-epoxy-1,2-dihydrophenyl)acetyl-CoA isomerase
VEVMMDFETIKLDIDGSVARITLNRPDRLNAFTRHMHQELRDAVHAIGDARVVVVTGEGRAFCAGQDLNDRAHKVGLGATDLGETVETCWNPLVHLLADLPQPIIARVNGVAAGAGASLALACDLVIAARSARFIQSFAALGLVPDTGGSWHLTRHLGQARAMGLAMTGEPLSAEQAAEWGLIWKCVDDADLDATVDALAAKLAALPPLGLAATKQMIRTSWDRTLKEELVLQRDEMRRLGFTDDYQEGVAAFLEKRPATFKGC